MSSLYDWIYKGYWSKVPITKGVPSLQLRFRAFEFFKPEDTRIVILGQDPYHSVDGEGNSKANGLSFGINQGWEGRRHTSSFGNIMDAVGVSALKQGFEWSKSTLNQWSTLSGWAEQGILLLNTRLSVAPGKPMSHAGLGWEDLTGHILAKLAAEVPDIIWVAFGAEARKAYELADVPRDKLIVVSHPSKYSATRGSSYAPAFVGSGVFDQINASVVGPKINWLRIGGSNG